MSGPLWLIEILLNIINGSTHFAVNVVMFHGCFSEGETFAVPVNQLTHLELFSTAAAISYGRPVVFMSELWTEDNLMLGHGGITLQLLGTDRESRRSGRR